MKASKLEMLKQIARGLAAQFGPNCEIVVHDLAASKAVSYTHLDVYKRQMQACSIGGGQIVVQELDGVPVNFTGSSNTLIIHNRDSKGYIADVTRCV